MIIHKQFKHIDKPNFPDLQRIDDESGVRKYLTPDGNLYPSVTTVLGKLNEKAISAWKKRVGKEEAEKITKYAFAVGTPIHELFERYINNERPDYRDIKNPLQRNMFLSMKPYLDKVDNVVCQEQPMYSDILRLAGTTDLIAEYDGFKSIIDFKTSRKLKEESHIKSYFLQATIYSIMLQELTGLIYPWVTILLVTYSGEVAVFRKHRKIFFKEVLDFINEHNN
jgi:genome maintenance exonuclease 1